MTLQQGPDYRLYKSEPELTTVTEVDENNGEERAEHPSEHAGNKGSTDSTPGIKQNLNIAIINWQWKQLNL